MDYLFLPTWPLQFNETMPIAVALLLASLAGEVLARLIKLPRICGYSLTGIALGPSLCGWFGIEDLRSFRILIDLTLALLLFELGIRVDLHWFRKNPWILASSIAEASLTFASTFAALHLMGSSAGFAATVAAIAISTSPAVVMRIAAELRAEGQVTQRLFVHTALNILYSIVLSKLIVGGMHGAFRSDWNAAVLHPLYLLAGSLLMGLIIAAFFRLLRRFFKLSDEQGVAILFGLLLLALAVLKSLALPSMLAPLLAGVMVRYWDRRPHLWPAHFGTAGGVLVILLFVFTGVTLTGQAIATGGLTALVLIAVRALSKCAGVTLFGPLSGISRRQSLALGVALLPMSGIAFLLVEDIRSLYPEFGTHIGAVVLSMVAVMEIAGPIGVQWALTSAHESKQKEGA
jgi:Kef-type K+ transport system membrane component KefB